MDEKTRQDLDGIFAKYDAEKTKERDAAEQKRKEQAAFVQEFAVVCEKEIEPLMRSFAEYLRAAALTTKSSKLGALSTSKAASSNQQVFR